MEKSVELEVLGKPAITYNKGTYGKGDHFVADEKTAAYLIEKKLVKKVTYSNEVIKLPDDSGLYLPSVTPAIADALRTVGATGIADILKLKMEVISDSTDKVKKVLTVAKLAILKKEAEQQKL